MRETLSVPGVANAWGLTEFPVVTSPAPDAERGGARPTVGTTGARGAACAWSEGELRLKGPQCFLGYVDASLDADAFDDDGWFRSGDQGRIDDDGNVVITGRIKDAIIRNAENISALEIEGVLATHPAVADVAVIGVPDPRTGERVCAVVVAAPGADVVLVNVGAALCGARTEPAQDPRAARVGRRVAAQPDRQGAQGRTALTLRLTRQVRA